MAVEAAMAFADVIRAKELDRLRLPASKRALAWVHENGHRVSPAAVCFSGGWAQPSPLVRPVMTWHTGCS